MAKFNTTTEEIDKYIHKATIGLYDKSMTIVTVLFAAVLFICFIGYLTFLYAEFTNAKDADKEVIQAANDLRDNRYQS